MKTPRQLISMAMAGLIVLQGTMAVAADGTVLTARAAEPEPFPAVIRTAASYTTPPGLDEVVKLPSWEIAALAEKFEYSPHASKAKSEAARKKLKQREEEFKKAAKATEKQIEAKEKELRQFAQRTDDPEAQEKRKQIRCEIAEAKKGLVDRTFEFLQEQIASDVEVAKLNLLAEWRGTSNHLNRRIDDGSIDQRRFGNVLDIGARSSQKPFRGQEDDVKWGDAEVKAARQRGQLPKEIDDPVVTEYVNRLANNLARHSDLTVPPKVFVVQQEVRKNGRTVPDEDGQPQQVANAMALPGGFLFIYSGIILESQTESELAGVIAHEMAHASARHGHRMANKGKWFNIAQLGAMIGLQVFAPGLFQAASYLGYQLKGLLLQGIFSGLGLVFTLDALGVSRDFELEADQLGMQNAWKAGYDPRGFVNLFDRMSQKHGNASRAGFFATHPAYGNRILNGLKEHKALHAVAPDRRFLTDTSEFHAVQERLRNLLRKTPAEQTEDAQRPTLNPENAEPAACAEVLPPPPPVPPIRTTEQEEVKPATLPVPDRGGEDEETPPVLRRQDDEG